MSVQVGSSRSIDRPTALSSVSVRLFTPSYSKLYASTPHIRSTYMTLLPASISHALLVSWPKPHCFDLSLLVCVLLAWCCHPRNSIESQMPERKLANIRKASSEIQIGMVCAVHACMLACAFAWACPSARVTRCMYVLRERNSVLRE
ncbi:hypothetical protein V8C44DRAFT_352873 [Trichoderma aethiopicum]